MTLELFTEQQAEQLEKVPVEFRAVLSYMAYERCHGAGYEETLNYLTSLVADLSPSIKLFAQRLAALTEMPVAAVEMQVIDEDIERETVMATCTELFRIVAAMKLGTRLNDKRVNTLAEGWCIDMVLRVHGNRSLAASVNYKYLLAGLLRRMLEIVESCDPPPWPAATLK